MKTPLISIIVPVYNMEAYLGPCVDSLLSQTFRDFELLLVDDGSSDGSYALCKTYAGQDSRVLVVRQSNGGVSQARNAGLALARGTFVCFVDADDWVEKDWLEQLMSRMEDLDILFFGFSWDYSDGSSRSVSVGDCRVADREGVERCMLRLRVNEAHENLFGFTFNKLFKTSLIRRHQLQFLPDVQLGEDEIFTLQYCMHAGSLGVVSLPLYHYRQRPGSLIHQKDTARSVLCKYHVVEELVGQMTLPSLRREWARYAYHALQGVAKLSGNVIAYVRYYAMAVCYKARHRDVMSNG